MGILLESLKEDKNILYHGSIIHNLKYLEPRNERNPSDGLPSRVFSTNTYYKALVFAQLDCKVEAIGSGDVNGKFYIKELIPNAFDLYKTEASIYLLDKKYFKKYNANEFYSYKKVPVKVESFVSSVYDELMNSYNKVITIIKYEETLYDEYYKDGRKK